MDIGMLWYDDDKLRVLAEKVTRAANFYQNKFGVRPNACYVHPDMLPHGEGLVGDIVIHGSRTVIKNHLWLGVEVQPVKS